MWVCIEHKIFKDILAYLSQGTSLDEFLKSFDTEKTKALFPHKVTQNISKYLKETQENKHYMMYKKDRFYKQNVNMEE